MTKSWTMSPDGKWCQGCLGPHPYRKCPGAKKAGDKGAGKR